MGGGCWCSIDLDKCVKQGGRPAAPPNKNDTVHTQHPPKPIACLALVAHVHGNGIQLGGHVIPLACMILDMLLDVTMLQTPQPASLVGTAALQAA